MRKGVRIFLFVFAVGMVVIVLPAYASESVVSQPKVERVAHTKPVYGGLYGERFCRREGFFCGFVDETNVYTLIERTRDGKSTWVRPKKHTHEYHFVNLKTGERRLLGTAFPEWEAVWPEEREREIVMKLNRVNIVLRLDMVVAVPDDMAGKTFMDYSPLPADLGSVPDIRKLLKLQDGAALPSEKFIVWDPAALAWGAYEGQKLVRWGPGVGGMDFCADVQRSCRTITGVFRVIFEGDAEYRSMKYPLKTCRSNKPGRPGCAPMPYFVQFHWGGYGFHGSPDVPGRHASHGCVRMLVSDAEWLNLGFAVSEVRTPKGKIVQKGTLVLVKPYPGKEKLPKSDSVY